MVMPSRRLASILASASLLALALAACGGEVTTATGGHGGGSSTSTSTGPGGAPACPTSPPGSGLPCAASGQSCSYGNGCCPLTFLCDGGSWQELATGCGDPPISCPPDPPAPGQACDPCFEPGPCTYPCAGTSAQVTATCSSGGWAIAGTCPAPPPVDCGGTPCKPGEICVATGGGAGISYACAADPCAPAPLSCTCAAKLCGEAPYVCGGAMGQVLECSCPVCP